jgi:hypothetical protein
VVLKGKIINLQILPFASLRVGMTGARMTKARITKGGLQRREG